MRPVRQHAGRWTPDRVKEAQSLLFVSLSLTRAASVMGISRMALTNVLKRNNAMLRRAWV